MNYKKYILSGLFTFLLFVSSASSVSAANRKFVFNRGDSYGKVDQSFGVIIPATISDALVTELDQYFGDYPIRLKIINPSPSLVSTSQFQALNAKGYTWYMKFDNESSIEPFLAAYYPTNTNSLVIETSMTPTNSVIQALKSSYPNALFHVGGFSNIDRPGMRDAWQNLQPPTVESVATGITDHGNEGFMYVRIMFDTLFDINRDIDAGTGVKINAPSGASYAVSSMHKKGSPPESEGYLAGITAASVVADVGKDSLPFKYTIANDFTQYSSFEKTLLSYIALFFAKEPELVWPMAVGGVGNPWDWGDPGDQLYTKPVVGMIGDLPEGIFSITANLSNETMPVEYEEDLIWADYTYISNTRPNQTTVPHEGRLVTFEPNEVAIIVPTNLSIDPPPITPPPANCETQKLSGDFNCDGMLNLEDFTYWSGQYLVGNSGLKFFEYFRRAHLGN